MSVPNSYSSNRCDSPAELFKSPLGWDWTTERFVVEPDTTDHSLTEIEDLGVDTHSITQPDPQKDGSVVAFDSKSLGNLRFVMSQTILAFMSDIADRSRKALPEVVILFGPFVLDCFIAWITRNGRVPRRCTEFERVTYFNEMSRLDAPGVWLSGILEAANATIGHLLEVSLTISYPDPLGTLITTQIWGRWSADLCEGDLRPTLLCTSTQRFLQYPKVSTHYIRENRLSILTYILLRAF